MKVAPLAQSRRFGRNGKPCEVKSYFLLVQNSDQRKLVLCQTKKAFNKEAWNEKLDWLLKIKQKKAAQSDFKLINKKY